VDEVIEAFPFDEREASEVTMAGTERLRFDIAVDPAVENPILVGDRLTKLVPALRVA
jgi:hypothetical protein